MSRLGPVQEYVVVAWQDSDIPIHINDRTYSGKLIKLNDKENQEGIEAPASQNNTLKKKRVSRKSAAVGQNASSETDRKIETSSISDALNSASVAEHHKYEKETNKHFEAILNHYMIGTNGLGASTSETLSNKTSNNRLDASLRVSYSEMSETLKKYKPKYGTAVENINDSFVERHFNEWNHLVNFGFNVLVSGVGSKKKLIEKYCQMHLSQAYYLVLLGYHPDFNTKNLLKRIITDILELTETFKTSNEQLMAINKHLKTKLFLIIHNIDGNCLRDSSIQYCLSELANNQYIHIIATIDHINSSLLWDHNQYVSFKWIQFELNTFMPYSDEIMFENSLMLNQTGNVQLSSLIHVLKSLTQNAKSIFLLMVQHVLNVENTKKNITFSKLYHDCREKFFVSNEMTLRAQLIEFTDHKLIKIKTESDGYEVIQLLVDEKNLKHYQDELKDKV